MADGFMQANHGQRVHFAIVEKLLAYNCHAIALESAAGRGTTVTITFQGGAAA